MASLANAQKLILGHFSSRYSNLDEFLTEAQSIFENTELAIEGKLFNL
jgi:ribonuclease Z